MCLAFKVLGIRDLLTQSGLDILSLDALLQSKRVSRSLVALKPPAVFRDFAMNVLFGCVLFDLEYICPLELFYLVPP